MRSAFPALFVFPLVKLKKKKIKRITTLTQDYNNNKNNNSDCIQNYLICRFAPFGGKLYDRVVDRDKSAYSVGISENNGSQSEPESPVSSGSEVRFAANYYRLCVFYRNDHYGKGVYTLTVCGCGCRDVFSVAVIKI